MSDAPRSLERSHRQVNPPEPWQNAYCTNCLRTQRFLDRTTHMLCGTCSKRLDKVVPVRRYAS